MKEIRRYQDFVLFVVYIVFIINIFLQRCSTWWVRHSYCTTPLYCQYFLSLKISYKKFSAFMLKFHVFALLMYFMNRFCCCLWASRLTNIFPLMKSFMIFKRNMQKNDISHKLNFAKFATYEALIYKNNFQGNFLEGTRKASK